MDIVTGGGSFLGRSLIRLLHEDGERVRVVIGSRPAGQALRDAGVELLLGDLCDPTFTLRALDGADRIFHLAGTRSALTGLDLWRQNVQTTLNLARAFLMAGGGRFVLLSTQAAGGPAMGPRGRGEEEPPAPVTLYGRARLAAEQAVASLPEPLSWTILRPGFLYGPGSRDLASLDRWLRWGRVPAVNPDQRLSPVFVDDVARALILAARRPEAHRRLFHVAAPPDLTRREWVVQAARAGGYQARCVPVAPVLAFGAAWASWVWAQLLGRPFRFGPAELAAWRIPSWSLQAERIRAELNWEPALSHQEGLQASFGWLHARKAQGGSREPS